MQAAFGKDLELRNEIAHEYSFNKEAVVRSLQKIFGESDRLLQIHEGVFEYCRRKFPEAISEPQK